MGFGDSYKLEYVQIGYGTELIGDGAFGNCIALARIIVSLANTNYSSIDEVLFQNLPDDSVKLHTYPAAKDMETYTVPETTSAIGAYAFAGASSLINLMVTENVKVIGDYAFSGSSSLVMIFFEGDVNSPDDIGLGIFDDNTSPMFQPDIVDQGNMYSYCEDNMILDTVRLHTYKGYFDYYLQYEQNMLIEGLNTTVENLYIPR